MLCVEDYIDTLEWAQSVGGLSGLIARCDANARAVADFVAEKTFLDFLARDQATRSNTSVCLVFSDPEITALTAEAQADFAKSVAALLEKEGVGLDLGSYRDAPPGLRIWCGATVQTSDVSALMPWIEWAFVKAKSGLLKAA
jgi:phosphoserine aminotransferase